MTIRAILKKRKSFFLSEAPFILSFITPPRFSRAVWYQRRAVILQRQGVSAPRPHAVQVLKQALSVLQVTKSFLVVLVVLVDTENSRVCFISLMSVLLKANFKPILFFKLSFDTSPEDCVTKYTPPA